MEDQKQRSFTFEIDNFSEKEAEISSPIFESGGCEWFLKIRPKRNYHLDHLCVYLHVANHESLRRGWKIRANYCFITLNQSGNVLLRTSEVRSLFCAEVPAWGVLPLTEAQEKRFLDKNKLIIKVQVKVVEVIHEGKSTENEMADYYGFHILCSQAYSVSQIFVEHPDFALDFRPKEKKVKTTYMNVLLDLSKTLSKPCKSFSYTELSNARSDLSELTEAGFQLDWLNIKLEEVSLEWKKSVSPVKQFVEHVKNLKVELGSENVELFKFFIGLWFPYLLCSFFCVCFLS